MRFAGQWKDLGTWNTLTEAMEESVVGKGSRFTLSLPDRQVGPDVSDIPMDYTGGFNRTLLALADALPAEAFRLRNQD